MEQDQPEIFGVMEAMEQKLVRIEKVEARTPTALLVTFRGERKKTPVELAGWIATGGESLAPLRNADLFAKVKPSDFGAAVSWDDGEGDLSIDAVHLKKLADEQRPFSNADVRSWQDAVKVSNNEAAALLGIAVSTWNAYKANAAVPATVAILLRAMLRDPLVMQAHLKPARPAGRPAKEATGTRD
jgi:DNA-binding transcriptional regulator YiaG